MAKKTVNERLKELRKETNFKPDKKNREISIIDVSKHKKKKRKKQIQGFKKFYRDYLNSLPEYDREAELLNLEIMMSYPTIDEIIDDIKRESSINKQKSKEYNKTLKKASPKNLSELQDVRKKHDKREEKIRKKLKKQGFNIYDPMFTVVKIDEKKMIKNLKKISKETEERSEKFLEYVDKLWQGGDMPDCIDTLNEKNKEIDKNTRKLIDSFERSNLKAGIRIRI